MISEP
ncbi:phosphate ABC transporter, permease domain protein, partial [Vibrio parahaemolyticus V-223/04]